LESLNSNFLPHLKLQQSWSFCYHISYDLSGMVIMIFAKTSNDNLTIILMVGVP